MSGTDANNIWEGDLLGRKDDGIYLQRFIENSYRMDTAHKNSFVLNINSEWGSGKTWFLERFAKQLKQNHPVVYFDAWKNDFTKDPLTSLIAVICQSMEEHFSGDSKAKRKVALVRKSALKFIKPSLPVLLAALVKHYSGVTLLENVEEGDDDAVSENNISPIKDISSSLTQIAASEAMSSFYKQKKGIDEFIDAVKSFVTYLNSTDKNGYLPICIFIDELDRCRPTYAIELLEAVKHIFSIGGLFFIIATDSKQLAHSINAVYGQKFDSSAYLKRFFYTEYSLSSVDYARMAAHLFAGFDFENKLYLPSILMNRIGIDGYFAMSSDFFQLTPREQEQIFINLKHCVLSSDLEYFHFSYLLFLLCMKLKHENVYENMMQKNDSKDFDSFMKSKNANVNSAAVFLRSERGRGLKGNPDEIEISDIVNFYVNLSKLNFKDINPGTTTHLYQDDIATKIRGEAKRDHSGNIINVPSITDYFSLITQAGKLLKTS